MVNNVQVVENKIRERIVEELSERVKTLNIIIAAMLLKLSKQRLVHKDVGITITSEDISDALGYEIEEVIGIDDESHTFRLKREQRIIEAST